MILTESEIIFLAGVIAILVELTLITYYTEKLYTFLTTDWLYYTKKKMKINRQKIEYTCPGYFPIITYITTNVQPNNEKIPTEISSNNWVEGPNYTSYNKKISEDEIITIITETYLEKMLNCSFQFWSSLESLYLSLFIMLLLFLPEIITFLFLSTIDFLLHLDSYTCSAVLRLYPNTVFTF